MEPAHLWRHFAALNNIPRPSGQEEAARAYVQQIADENGATSSTDAQGNIIVRLPARNGGNPSAPVVAIQSHLDMVCEKRPEIEHDFDIDPILPRRLGDLIYATGTTLGADNGIGAAAALAVLTAPGLQHGPLELIFTVEEETGLCGAMALEPAALQAEMLINLDSEDPDELTIGCAGGAGTRIHLPYVPDDSLSAKLSGFRIVVSGLKGGHSGVQIHEPLGNATKILTQTLRAIEAAGISFHLSSLQGGSAHNAIPRDAEATLAVASEAVSALEETVAKSRSFQQAQWEEDEPELSIILNAVEPPSRFMSATTQQNLVDLLENLPHGILQMSQVFPGKVQTSNNLAVVRTNDETIRISTSSRSFIPADIERVQEDIQSQGIAAGAQVKVEEGYPGWEPSTSSRLLEVTQVAYEKACGKPPRIEVIHAGLECGVIVSKKPEMEAISFGPLIRGAHSPEEHVAISTVEPTWNLLVALLADLSGTKSSAG